MPPRAPAGGGPPSDPMYIGNLWAMVQMLMARGIMTEADVQKEFARITGKPQPDLFAAACERANLELTRLALVVRRVRSPLTGRVFVGVANLSPDAPAKAVGSRYSHAQREFFARVLEAIATDPNARNGVCTATSQQLLNLDLSRPSSINAAAAAAARTAATATTTAAGAGGGKKGGKKGPAVKKQPGGGGSDDDDDDAAGGADGGAGGAAAATAAAHGDGGGDDDDDDDDARTAAASAAQQAAADAVRRMSLKERGETLASLAREGWLEARPGMAGHFSVGPRSFIELSGCILGMNLKDSTRDVWEHLL